MRKFRKVKALKLKEKQSKMNFPTEVEGVFIWCDLFKMTSNCKNKCEKVQKPAFIPKELKIKNRVPVHGNIYCNEIDTSACNKRKYKHSQGKFAKTKINADKISLEELRV